jgi:hypothetical protein
MIETAVVFDEVGRVIYYHLPKDRTAGSIPDSRRLWDVMEAHVDTLGGTAHTHPSGYDRPSQEDVTSWSAAELGLAKRFLWAIATKEKTTFWRWVGPGPYDYAGTNTPLPNMEWGLIGEAIDRLKDLSGMNDES